MTRKRRAISKTMKHQLQQSVADVASVIATHNARAAIVEKVEKATKAAEEKRKKAAEEKKKINSDALAGGGKANPAKFPTSGLVELTEGEQPVQPTAAPKKAATPEYEETTKSIFCPILKANNDKKTVIGVVLQPEVVDAQGDIISEEVIEKAAEDFLARFNKATKLGFMHTNFSKKFELLQSYIAPSDIVIGTTIIKKGSWIMKVRVIDAKVWKLVKEGKVTGFSIGGKARVVKLNAAQAA